MLMTCVNAKSLRAHSLMVSGANTDVAMGLLSCISDRTLIVGCGMLIDF